MGGRFRHQGHAGQSVGPALWRQPFHHQSDQSAGVVGAATAVRKGDDWAEGGTGEEQEGRSDTVAGR